MRKTRWQHFILSASLADCVGASHRLAARVADSYQPDSVLAVLQGGVVPALVVAEDLGLSQQLFALAVRRRRDVERLYRLLPGSAAGLLHAAYYWFSRPVVTPENPGLAGGRVLVVDDRADTGATLEATVEHLRERCGAAEVRTAVLAWLGKRRGRSVPDHYAYTGMLKFPWSAQSSRENPDFHGEYCAFIAARASYLASRGLAIEKLPVTRAAGRGG